MLEKIVNWFDKFEDVVSEIVQSVPQGDKLFHASFLGALPFYVGTKLNEKFGKKLNPYVAGFLSTALTEGIWELFIDPRLEHSATSLKLTVQDFAASLAGAVICTGLYSLKYRKLIKKDSKKL